VRIVKTILTVVIIAVGVVAAAVALFWEQLLTPEQKMQYGLTFSAKADYAARARLHPDNTAILSDYAEALAVSGNLGRAKYLCDLYGARSATLEQLRPLIDMSLAAAARDEVYPVHEDEAAQAVDELPAGQALRYLEGYQHALRGDWSSARNFFAAINEKQLAPPLRPYWRYYLARSYRLAGDDEEQAQIEDLLTEITTVEDCPPQLKAQARYNLIAWYLSADYAGPDALALATAQLSALDQLPAGWPLQKAHTEFAEYYLGREEYQLAWEHCQLGLQVDPLAQAGKRSGELIIEILTKALDEKPLWGMQEDGALTLTPARGIFTALADCAVRHGFAAEAAVLLDRLKPHLASNYRASWEELRVGMARCYRAERNSAALKDLMADANLRDLSDSQLGEIYFQYARLLQDERRWNGALDYYQSAAKLSGARAGESLYQCYAILKQVQDPLNLERAEQYLLQVVQEYPTSEAMPKAVEELLPLMIFRGEQQAAGELIRWLDDRVPPNGSRSAAEQKTAEQLREVLSFWRVQLLEKAGDAAEALQVKRQISCKYWNYYEVMSSYPPQPELAFEPGALAAPESAAEYLLGLGLPDSARQDDPAAAGPAQQILDYIGLVNDQVSLPQHSLQWHATELLESGGIREQAVLDYVLPLAYPRPFQPEVAAAAQEFGVPANLIWAVMKKESNFRPDAVSWAGAQGLMQLMPTTASWLDAKYDMGIAGRDIAAPAVNIRLGAAYLASLFEIFGAGNIRAVIHAYNGGDGNYRKWRERYGADQLLLTELIPNEENETFGKKVIRYYKIYEWLSVSR